VGDKKNEEEGTLKTNCGERRFARDRVCCECGQQKGLPNQIRREVVIGPNLRVREKKQVSRLLSKEESPLDMYPPLRLPL